MHHLPYVDKASLELPPRDGFLLKTIQFCKDRARSPKKCQTFLRTIATVPGFHICPVGFSCYIPPSGSVIYCSILVEGFFNSKKVRPKMGEEHIFSMRPEMTQKCAEVHLITEEALIGKQQDDLVDTTLHEIRKLNRDIKSQTEDLTYHLTKEPKADLESMRYRVANIYATSSLLSVRLNAFDLIANPDAVVAGGQIPFEIYRKFQKTIHCLNNRALQGKVGLRLRGECYRSIHAHTILEILPYALLENAIKYSPENYDVTVSFWQRPGDTEVTVTNIGPLVLLEEVSNLFLRKRRGTYAGANFPGTGIGLFFAKQVCDLHDIEIDLLPSQIEKFRLNGVPYAEFKVRLLFAT